MASQDSPDLPVLELTQEETKLRELLLAVASYIDEAPPQDTATTVKVPGELTHEKVVLRWTGGWVRDKLLGVGSHDIDVAINKMTGENFGLKMLKYLKTPGNLEKHQFGNAESKIIMSGLHTIKANPEASKNLETATIKIMGIDLDLVNLRKETYNEVSRNPQMEFGTAEEDAMRRDATVNAMFYNLHTQQIEDFTERGFEDMAAKIIRTPLEPYQTFKDDPLRVLRLIRFASRLDYALDTETAKAMADKEIQEALKIKIKRERVGIEMEKMLRGPDPPMALRLIDEAGLYETIFTDPNRDIRFQPDVKIFRKGYEFMDAVTRNQDGSSSILNSKLLSTPDERYLAWVCAAVIPWADAPMVPHPKKNRPPYHAAYLVAQEGLKTPNRVSDILVVSLDNRETISNLIGEYYGKKQSSKEISPEDRSTIGMALRSWGASWRSQVLFTLLHEVVFGSQSTKSKHSRSELSHSGCLLMHGLELTCAALLSQYTNFINLLAELDLLDCVSLKPLVNGKELAKALDVKPGPWMKDALDVVMAWQLRNPSATDPAEAIEEVKKTSKSELPSRLMSHFLTLTIRPLFSQNDPTDEKITLPWKKPENEYFAGLLKWILSNMEENDVRIHFRMIRPPIMQMLEDGDLEWNARACQFITLLVRRTPPTLKKDCWALFHDQLYSFFNYLPSLTPASDSANLLQHVYPALLAFSSTAEHRIAAQAPSIQDPPLAAEDIALLDTLIRQGIITPFFHFPTPTTYPALATLLLTTLSNLLPALGIHWVKHANDILPLIHSILRDNLAPTYPALPLAAATALRLAIVNGWPRMRGTRALEAYSSAAAAWVHCEGYMCSAGVELEGVREELKKVVKCAEMVMGLDSEAAELWKEEVERARREEAPWVELLEGCGGEGVGGDGGVERLGEAMGTLGV